VQSRYSMHHLEIDHRMGIMLVTFHAQHFVRQCTTSGGHTSLATTCCSIAALSAAQAAMMLCNRSAARVWQVAMTGMLCNLSAACVWQVAVSGMLCNLSAARM
jgi:hypothetical protein